MGKVVDAFEVELSWLDEAIEASKLCEDSLSEDCEEVEVEDSGLLASGRLKAELMEISLKLLVWRLLESCDTCCEFENFKEEGFEEESVEICSIKVLESCDICCDPDSVL